MGTTRETIEKYVDGWRTGDRDAWIANFRPDASFIDPVGTPPNDGHEAILAFFDRVQAMPMTYTPVVDRIVECGGEGVLLFIMQARDERGAGMDIRVVDVFRMDDEGRIVELKAYWDKNCQTMIQPTDQ